MTTDTRKLAEMAGFTLVNYSIESPPEADPVWIVNKEQLDEFARLVREECAKQVKDMARAGWDYYTIATALSAGGSDGAG
jgi:hypothetical protein